LLDTDHRAGLGVANGVCGCITQYGERDCHSCNSFVEG
jgi:hypothetical protein